MEDVIGLDYIENNPWKVEGYRRYIKYVDDEEYIETPYSHREGGCSYIAIRTLKFDGHEYSCLPYIEYLTSKWRISNKNQLKRQFKYLERQNMRIRIKNENGTRYAYPRYKYILSGIGRIHDIVQANKRRTGEYIYKVGESDDEYRKIRNKVARTCLFCGAAMDEAVVKSGVNELSHSVSCKFCNYIDQVPSEDDSIKPISLVRVDTDELRGKAI